MWVDANGKRRLIAPSQRIAEFVSAVYYFDEVLIAPVDVVAGMGEYAMRTDRLSLDMTLGRRFVLPLNSNRPLWFTRHIEGPVARMLLGVETFGESPMGVHEWYVARSVRRCTSARAIVDGNEAGKAVPLTQQLGVGFTNPPTWASLVSIRPALYDPTGALDELVVRLNAA